MLGSKAATHEAEYGDFYEIVLDFHEARRRGEDGTPPLRRHVRPGHAIWPVDEVEGLLRLDARHGRRKAMRIEIEANPTIPPY